MKPREITDNTRSKELKGMENREALMCLSGVPEEHNRMGKSRIDS